MPEFDIEVVNKTYEVSEETVLYFFFLMPPKDQLAEIILAKEKETVPTYVRVRVGYWVSMDFPGYGGFDIYMIDCSGGEFQVASEQLTPFYQSVEDSRDITEQLTKCGGAQPFGLNALKLILRKPYVLAPTPSPVTLTAKYSVRIRVYGTWGW